MADSKETLRRYQEAQAKRARAKQEAHTTKEDLKKPTKDYRAMMKRYQEAHTTPIVDDPINKAQADNPSRDSVYQKIKQDVADMKTTLIKWTIIILIAACVFYFVYPKYSFRFPTSGLWKANKITGTVEVYSGGRWSAR